MTGKLFRESIIAQDDDNDYPESGYVAAVFTFSGVEIAVLARYSHCSCFDTWADLCGGGISDYYPEDEEKQPVFNWIGSPDALFDMALRTADPIIPTRSADPNDYDYDHLVNVYQGVLDWALGHMPL